MRTLATKRIEASERRTIGRGHLRLIADSADHACSQAIAFDLTARSDIGRVKTSIRVTIAAEKALVRAGYRALLEHDERLEVVGEAACWQQALALAARTAPGVALLAGELPGQYDAETIARVVSDPGGAGVAVLLIATLESEERVISALRAGAIGVLSKDAEPGELIRAVQLLADGYALLPAVAVRSLLSELPPHFRHDRHLNDQLAELTDREREVVALAAEGLTNGEIAARLVISPATAKTHVTRAMTKVHARDRAQLVVLAYETGLVPVRNSSG